MTCCPSSDARFTKTWIASELRQRELFTPHEGDAIKLTVSVSRDESDIASFEVLGQKGALGEPAFRVVKRMQEIIRGTVGG